MRTPFCLLALVLLAAPSASAAKRVTIQELVQILTALHAANQPDAAVAGQLKQLQLSEELTSADRDTLTQFLPGDLSLEQMEVLRGLSAFEPPAPSRVPATPAPNDAAQKTILAGAGNWLTSTFLQSPIFTASKVTIRYQDDVQKVANHPGLTIDLPNTYTQLSEAYTDYVTYTQGVAKFASSRKKTDWGSNGEISEGGPIPSLAEIFEEATATGKLMFARWELINGKPAAVFSFAVDKKKTRYNVSYCCFPETDTATGVANSGTVVAPGQIQSVTTWHPFRKTVPYHGFLFIDPATGAILRSVTFAELKPTDLVHSENVRFDYTSDVVDGKPCIVPERSFTINEHVPTGDAGTRGYSVRHALFISIYGNYHPGGAQ